MNKIKLYKYLPEEYVDDFVTKGNIFFRNLTYFRQYEDNRRGDPLEGFHRDNPDNDVVLYSPNSGKIAKGDYSYLNSTNTDLIYVFCLSCVIKEELFTEFGTDFCVEISNLSEFSRRLKVGVKRRPFSYSSGLIQNNVKYYKDNAPADFDIKNPKNLAFAKGIHYCHQEEYRFVFGESKKAFNLKQQIVDNKKYDFIGEAKKGQPMDKTICIGNIKNITAIHRGM